MSPREMKEITKQAQEFYRAVSGFVDEQNFFKSIFLAWLSKTSDDVPKAIKDGFDKDAASELKSFWNRMEGNSGMSNPLVKVSYLFDEKTLKKILLYYDFDDFGKNPEIMPTPDGICKLAAEILQINEEDNVMDLCCGTGRFMMTAFARHAKSVSGVDINPSQCLVAKIRGYILRGNFSINCGDALNEKYNDRKITKVFVNGPLGLSYKDYEQAVIGNKKMAASCGGLKIVSGEWAFTLAAHVFPGAKKKIAIMSQRGLFVDGDKKIRQQLVEEGAIEAIIQLPGNMYSGTNIPFVILVLSEGNHAVRFIDATKFHNVYNRKNYIDYEMIDKIMPCYRGRDEEYQILVDNKEIAAEEYELLPRHYLQKNSFNEIKNAIPLGSVLKSLGRGHHLDEGDLERGSASSDIQYLMIQHIEKGKISSKNVIYLSKEPIESKYTIIPPDAIIVSNIIPAKIAINSEPKRKVIAGNNIFFLEVDKEQMDPLYVLIFLKSDIGQAQLRYYARGVVAPTISMKDLKKIKISKIDKEKQKELIDTYMKYTSKLDELDAEREETIKEMREFLKLSGGN